MSALIFVALAIAWAVYLIPMALKHHEAGDAARTVDGFSNRLRVLARREPVDGRTARLVVPGQPAPVAEASAPLPTTAEVPLGATAMAHVPAPLSTTTTSSRRPAAQVATKRRRRVLTGLMALLVLIGIVVATGLLPVYGLAAPVVLILAWLVACRLMVRQERAVPTARPSVAASSAPSDPASVTAFGPAEDEETGGPATEEIAAIATDVASDEPEQHLVEGGWDPVPVTLPTYVGKAPAARRTVRTIDLESTGVWTSGHTAGDSALAREADEAARQARADGSGRSGSAAQRRASGS